MEVLLRLASAPGEVVTRESLLMSVWGEHQGSQEALNHAIGEIRRALGDHSHEPAFVQTLPRRGYRLLIPPVLAADHTESVVLGTRHVASMTRIGFLSNLHRRGVFETGLAYLIVGWLIIQVSDIVFDQLLLPAWIGTFVTVLVIAGFPIAVALSWFLEFRDGRAVLDDQLPRDALRRRFSRTYLSVVGALAIAAAIVFVYDQNIGLPEAPTADVGAEFAATVLPAIADNSIAVLPFMNVDGSDDTRIFSNGLADDLITRLSRVPGLLVAARGDSFTLEPNSVSSRVRERLRVARYLGGSVEISGDQMRIIVQLIDSATGFHVLSRSFNRTREEFFDVRDEITELTVANIRVTLPPDTQAATVITEDHPDLDAYILYRHGVEESVQAKTSQTIDSALSWYDASLDVDPDYAAAHAGKCTIYVDAFRELDDSTYIGKAQESCANALARNPNLDVVHTALGDLYNTTGRYSEAESAFLKALEINSQSVAALTGLGTAYTRQGRPDEAEAWFRQAIGQHPGDWDAYNALGGFLYRSGRYAEAAAEFERAVAIDNSRMLGYSNLGTSHLLGGNFSAAAIALQRAIEIEPWPNTYSNLGLVHYYLGNYEKAVESHMHATELAPKDLLKWSNLGDALFFAERLKDATEAFVTAEELASDALSVNTNDPYTQIDLAWIKAMLGKDAAARALIERARSSELNDPYIDFIDGLVFLKAGQPGAAVTALTAAAEGGYSRTLIAAEPHLAALRESADFQAIIN